MLDGKVKTTTYVGSDHNSYDINGDKLYQYFNLFYYQGKTFMNNWLNIEVDPDSINSIVNNYYNLILKLHCLIPLKPNKWL